MTRRLSLSLCRVVRFMPRASARPRGSAPLFFSLKLTRFSLTSLKCVHRRPSVVFFLFSLYNSSPSQRYAENQSEQKCLFLSRNNFTVCNLLLGHSTGIKRVRMKTFRKGAKIWGILMIGVFNAARDPPPLPPPVRASLTDLTKRKRTLAVSALADWAGEKK